MGTFSADSYASAAAKLPKSLGAALARDLKLTTAEYLADAAASTRAVKVVASLKAAGVRVLGSKIKGTHLTVNVASGADVATVQASGATAVVGAPVVPDLSKVAFHSVSATNTYGGEAYFYQSASQVGTGSGFRCSIGFNGYSVANGAPQFVTAGHCAAGISGNAYLTTQSVPANVDNGNSLNVTNQVLGSRVAGETQYGGNTDYGIVNEAAAGLAPQASIYSWGSSQTQAPLAAAPISITGASATIVGANLCKSGSTSGWTCGTVSGVDQSVDVSGQTVNAIIASTCLLPGDSGGGAVVGQTAVGIDSGSSFPTNDCTAGADRYSVFFPMVSAAGDVSVIGQQGARWQLAVPVTATATVTGPPVGDTVTAMSSMTGTVSSPAASSTAILYLDGSTTPFARASASTGTWTIPLTGISVGTHSYAVAAGVGWAPGTPTTGTLQISAGYPVTGAIQTEYLSLGGSAGVFGSALSPVFVESVNGGGSAQGFQGGSIYQSSAGAFGVLGAIRNAYWAVLGEGGALGWPTAEQVCGLPSGGCSQAFQHGSIYWSASTGADVVSGAMLTAYLAAGGATGSLGLPASGLFTESVNGGGTAQGFQNGSIYQSTTGGAYAVSGPIRATYWSLAGEGGAFGWPTAAQVCGLSDGGCSQTFQGGSLVWSPTTGVRIGSTPAIEAAYEALGGPSGAFGLPVSVVYTESVNGGGTAQGFQNGSIYQSTAGAFGVSGVIRNAYWSAVGEGGVLGWPTASQTCGLPSGGCSQSFQNGSIYWSAATGAEVISGAMLTAYLAAGGATGALGLPASGLFTESVNGGGTAQGFQNGSIYQSVAGAFAVSGAIRAAYWAVAGEGGVLGWPTATQVCGLSDGGCSQTFQHGSIIWSPTTGARIGSTPAIEAEYEHLGGPSGAFGTPISLVYTETVNGGGTAQGFQNGSIYQSAAGAFGVSGAIRSAYWAVSGEDGALGWPTADQVCGLPSGGCSQTFQNGTIYWSPSTGANVMSGAMLTAYLAAGGPTGALGLPASALFTESVNGGGTAQGFQNGSMYQSSAGAFSVSGPIRAEYWSVAGEGGTLGWPTAAQTCPQANVSCTQSFQHGTIVWSSTDGAKVQ